MGPEPALLNFLSAGDLELQGPPEIIMKPSVQNLNVHLLATALLCTLWGLGKWRGMGLTGALSI